ncbi:MAG: preprotein translocase subunit SecE [Flavicella sp.]|jgi:preprotein translocase subunit SecE|nr:preprotein translocase subunit SecE [Flavicella sp.]MDG1503855.1 preprotein translocase subunit SecE [Flavicella sp.]|tara:strand:+ start:1448 stop:1639 length:192 start_codon:yes stop_codon:yes gene_type:complete
MSVVKYIKESFEELNNNMTWLPKAEAQKSTVVVAIFTVLFALAVFAVDSLFQGALDSFFNIFN